VKIGLTSYIVVLTATWGALIAGCGRESLPPEPPPLGQDELYEGKSLQEWSRILAESDEESRREAIWALEEYGPAAVVALPALTETLQHPDEHFRLYAIRAIGAIGPAGEPAVLALSAIVASPDSSAELSLRYHALSALDKIGSGAKDATAVITAVLLRPPGDTFLDEMGLRIERSMAAEALGDIGDASPPVLDALRRGAEADRDWHVRESCRTALRKLLPAADTLAQSERDGAGTIAVEVASTVLWGALEGDQPAPDAQHEASRSKTAPVADVDARDEWGDTPLHHVAANGNAKLARALIEAGADPNAKGRWGATPLHRAAERGNGEIVRILLRAGADVNARTDGGRTPLHKAADHDNLWVIELLLDAGADTSVRDSLGWTALERADYAGNRFAADTLRKRERLRRGSSEGGDRAPTSRMLAR
jgi:hypothetical protein